MTDPAAPPHDPDAERALLGAMLLARDAIDTAAATVTADDFYKPAYGHIYDAITTLHATGQHVDHVTVADQLTRDGLLDTIGGRTTLLDLVTATPSTTGAHRYAQIVAQMAMLRRLADLGRTLAADAMAVPEDPTALLDRAINELTGITPPTGERTDMAIDSDLDDHLALIDQRAETTVQGAPTGLADLDRHLGGLRPGQLIVGAGRPGMGKSDFAAIIALNCATAGYPTLYVSLEMDRTELMDRLLAAAADIPYRGVQTGRLSEIDGHRLAKGVGRLVNIPLVIDDNPGATIPAIRRAAQRHGARIVVIDYLQLMTSTNTRRDTNREQEVAALSRGAKLLARDLDCTVIALSQLNRSVEQRIDKRPMMSDLRESGAIENDADVILGLYRDEYYKPDSPEKGMLEILILKHRAGAAGTLKVAYDPSRKQLRDLARREAA